MCGTIPPLPKRRHGVVLAQDTSLHGAVLCSAQNNFTFTYEKSTCPVLLSVAFGFRTFYISKQKSNALFPWNISHLIHSAILFIIQFYHSIMLSTILSI
jgi:hypothetical protein